MFRSRRKDMRRPPSAPGHGRPPGYRVGLVGCVKRKGDCPATAKDLYISPLFSGRRLWVERSFSEWFLLSAMHGLVRPETVLDPYDLSLNALGAAQRRRWSEFVLGQMATEIGPLHGIVFEMHAGANYRNVGLADGLRRAGATVDVPTEGLSQGQQLQFYKRAREGQR